MPHPQIVVQDLVKTFHIAQRRPGMFGALRGLVSRTGRTVRALDGVSFTIQPGELVGYIGPNGAGKSTTVKILSGILVPTAGRCEVMGRVPWRDRIPHVRGIGVVFGQRTQLWWDLPVIESFELLRDIYAIDPAAYRRMRDELIAMLDLAPLLDTPVRQLSLGQRMRCDLAATLLHSPRLLFLDEPTIGLDAVAKLAVRDFVLNLNRKEGTTVILTTHDMDDIEALCTRVLVISNGRIFCDGTLGDLRARVSGERRLIVDLETGSPAPGSLAPIQDADATVVAHEGHRVHLSFDPRRIATPTLIARITARYPVRDLFVENPPIEQIIAQLYAGETSPARASALPGRQFRGGGVGAMKGYLSILAARFRTLLQYRAAALAGVATQVVFGLIMVMVYEALYRSSDAPQPMTIAQVVTYTWLGQAFLGLIPWNVDPAIQEMVTTGSVAYELCRPLDLYNAWYVRALAQRTAPTLLRCVPLIVLAMLCLGMRLPASPASGAAFLLALVGAALVAAAVTTLAHIFLLLMVDGRGVNRFFFMLVSLGSGLLMPIPLFPGWAQRVLNVLPFRAVFDIPCRLYVGHIPPGQAWSVLLFQLGWAAALVLLGRWLLGIAQRRLVAQGG